MPTAAPSKSVRCNPLSHSVAPPGFALTPQWHPREGIAPAQPIPTSAMSSTEDFIYYDTFAQKWTRTTLSDLATINDPELTICELNAAGTPGEQMTYGQFLQQRADAREAAAAEKAAAEAAANAAAAAQAAAENAAQQQANAIGLPHLAPVLMEPLGDVSYHYEVIEHTKYNGALGSNYDVEGLKRKLNVYGSRGYKLVGLCSPSCFQTENISALSSLFSNSPSHHDGLNIHGVVAIMEKVILNPSNDTTSSPE